MILVAGGTGFVGAAIVRELARRSRPVAVLSHRPEQARRRFPGLNVEVRAGDARDPASLRPAVAGVDTVISSMQFPNFPIENRAKGHTFEEVDARGNERLVAAAKEAGVGTYVYLSGAGAAADAPYHWFRAKWQAEEAIRAGGLRHSIFRPSWVYGPEDKALNRFVGLARALPFVPVVGNGRQRLQPVFIDDVARAVVDSLDNEAAANQTIEIGGPDVLTMDEILRTMLDVMGKKKPLIHAPALVPKIASGALMGIVPLENRPLSPDAVTFITMDALADLSNLRRVFPRVAADAPCARGSPPTSPPAPSGSPRARSDGVGGDGGDASPLPAGADPRPLRPGREGRRARPIAPAPWRWPCRWRGSVRLRAAADARRVGQCAGLERLEGKQNRDLQPCRQVAHGAVHRRRRG
ncbi:MAG: complex I NDUFA9 subunit family protein [Dehalococcoidia bacterium]